MKIQKYNNSTNFGSKFICPANIRVKIGGKWKNAPVSFVEIEPAKKSDRQILNAVSKLWDEKNLSGCVVEEAEILGKKSKIYGLTTQTENIDKLNPQEILGLMTTDKITKNKDVEIFKIGTNPKFAYEQNHRKRDVKHIARTMIDTMRKIIGSKSKTSELFVRYAEPEDMKFLTRVGLEPREKDCVAFINK